MKWKINCLQLVCLMVFPIIGAVAGIGTHIIFKMVNNDGYFCIIFMGLIGFLYLFMLYYLGNYNHNLSICDVSKDVFGKLFGNIINYVLIAICIIIALTNMFSISNFVSSQYLIRTPLFVVSLLMIIVITINVCKGFQVVSRVGFIILIINLLLFLIAVVGLIPHFKIDNFLPTMNNGVNKIISSSLIISCTNIFPLFILLSIPFNNLVDKHNIAKSGIILYSLSIFIVFLVILFTIGVLGKYLIGAYQYPEYVVLQKISFMNFIDRIENLVAMQWILGAIGYVSLLIYFITISIKHNSNDKPNPIVAWSSSLVIFILCNLSFKSNTVFNNFVDKVYPYICFSILPIMILLTVGAFFKKKRKKLAIK